MKFICPIILILLLIQSVKGQELYGKFLDHEQGLLSKECYDINYDEKGYLIVGTQYGPMKFDGEKFIPICINLPAERRVMYDFEKAPDGRVYLLNSINELFRLQNDSAIWIKPENQSQFKSPYSRFTKLYFRPGGIYIGSYNNYLKYSFKTNKIESYYASQKNNYIITYNSRDEFPFKKYFNPIILQHNKAWVKFPETNREFEVNRPIESRENLIKIGKTTYLLMQMQLFRMIENQVTKLDFTNIYFAEYFHNRIWLCTLDGLFELDVHGNLVHHHFKGQIVGGVAPLKSGGIAVSFNQKGVFISSDINNRVYYDFTATTAKKIHQLDLIGNLKGEVYQYQENKLSRVAHTAVEYKDIKRSYRNGIFDVFPHKRLLFSCSGYGIVTFSQDFKKIDEIIDQKNSIFSFFTFKDHYYLVTRTAIMKTTWRDLTRYTYPYNYSSKAVIGHYRCSAWLNDSILLVGTNDKLYKYHLHSDKLSTVDLPVKNTAITSLHVTGKDQLIVCTRYKGIYFTQGKKVLKKISSPCISIFKVLLFRNWLVAQGNDGIYIKNLTKSDNSGWIKFFSGETTSMFILQKKLLISYNNDLIIKKLSGSSAIHKPRILLNKCELGSIKTERFPTLIPANTPISVDIDILQFDVNRLDLYYKLKGENTITQLVEGTKINFDALKSGKYQLQVYPVIDKQIQFNNSKTFRFTIEKTFWESTIFYIGSAILLLLMIFSVFITLKLRRKKRLAERAELESKLNEYKLLAVKAQVNPHFLSNGLSAIQALILKEDNELAAQYLAKFSFLMRKILYYSETQFISLKQELELADAYLELELLRFRNRFVVRREISLSESQSNEFLFPSLLLQPILENAIWHGLKFREERPELRIVIYLNENRELVVKISDNGHGFKSSNQNEAHLSKGNKLINERIETLNQQFQKTAASMEITSSSSGTTVTFIFSSQIYLSVKP